MDTCKKYSQNINKSVNYIFQNLLQVTSIQKVDELQAAANDLAIVILMDGTLKAELILSFPKETLHKIASHFYGGNDAGLESEHIDLAGEIANQIAGMFAHHVQFDKHFIDISHPELCNTSSKKRLSYKDILLSYISDFGGIDVKFYYKELELL